MAHPRTRSTVLAVSLVTTLALSLTGCAADARVTEVEESISFAVDRATPLMIGVLTPDVAKALSEAGDQTRVMVPILAPDLTTAPDTVTAESSATELYPTAEAAAAALADSGQQAWQTWLEANRDAVSYVETSIPVTVSAKGDSAVSVQVDESALQVFAEPIEMANLERFVHTAEALPQWQRAMVVARSGDFLSVVTGLSETLATQAAVISVEPADQGRFAVAIRQPDAKASILYQVEKALESYGTGKIWGKVTQKDFERRMDTIVVPASEVPELTTEAVVRVETTGEATYDLSLSLADNLAARAEQYRAEAEPGSFPVPEDLGQVKDQAIADALAELAKRTVAEQKRPGTKLLVGGKSGSQVTIKTGGSSDKHITFFKWGSKKQVASAFVKKGKTIKLRLPAGNYRLVYASGDSWYGKKHSFGPTGQYQEFKTNPLSDKPMKIKIQRNYVYTVSIESGKAGDPGSVSSGSTENPFEE